ncbi:twin-arginine translocation signal domain-containing protein [Afipia felis]|uniref:Formate dehydrogenase region TAT target n=2 Tax=Afipia felis TaxID=1035 RepID=A0A380W5C3_AFIFE|nr:twin-arginine translocation signal domain-containing protein [Afipia felis]EKS31257.1 formate dehydrogenase region TAT target [Afipia felis ATCC 53690]SUU75999.1 formate dehydrogenase region TAT target [Afipia felis]SUU84066.1 formate dehydrogenase region TAT target [Afipia felis]
MKEDDKAAVGRRSFLRGVGIGALGAGAAVVSPLMPEAKADSETNDEKRKARYNPNSPDIKAYYRVNRYPK